MPLRARRPLIAVSLALAGLLAAGACARNPVTGNRELTLVSEDQEIQLGKDSREQILQTMPRYPDERVQRYVEAIGMRLAKASERPDLPWSFTVLDDATVNAFALPGGPIFVTRGIMTHLNSEAELAAVLGHEVGHITARHSVQQLSKAQLAQLGLGLGAIFSETVRNYGGAAVAGLQLLFLKYGRDAERQSDQLGYKYMTSQGYDPREMADVFVTLERASALAGAGKMPEWASTHPDPGSRAEAARKRVERQEAPRGGTVDREEYLSLVGGMTFGDDPRQGYFRGNAFYHPEMRFKVEFPEGWKTANTPQAVIAASPKEDAIVQLTLAGKLSPDEATRKFFSQEGVKPGKVEEGRISGLDATASYFEAQTQQGVVRGLVSFVAHGGTTFQLIGYTPADALQANDPAFRRTMGSFGPLNDPALLNVQPAKVELVKLTRDMSIQEFDRQYPSSVKLEQVAVINGVDEDGRLRAGQIAKRVVGGVKPQ